MKKLLAVLVAVFSLAGYASASNNIADDFVRHYTPASDLSAYNKDISTLVGMADFHTAKGTNFPGIDIGATFSTVKPSSANDISSEDFLYGGFLVAQTHIPTLETDIVVRGTNLNGLESYGAGLKYNYNLLDTVHLSFGGFYDNIKTDWYQIDHISLSAVASANVLMFTPYVGVGYDYGYLTTRNLPYEDRSSSDNSVRYTAGLNVKPFPFLYAFAAYTKTEGNQGFQGGVGFNF